MKTTTPRRIRMAALATLLTGGMVLGTGCSLRDLQTNLVAGTLAYVKGTATAFWDAFLPADDIFDALDGQ